MQAIAAGILQPPSVATTLATTSSASALAATSPDALSTWAPALPSALPTLRQQRGLPDEHHGPAL
jgi:hypothetical protein